MTRFLPIPRKDLPHTAVLVQGRAGAWDEEAGEVRETPLRHVRVSGGDGLGWALSGERADHGLTLFYDCVNSKPHGVRFAPGDRVRLDEREYEVAGARALCSDALNGAIHHWEVALR